MQQPIADALKLLMKEIISPTQASKVLYFIAPVMVIMPAFAAWAVIPFQAKMVLADVNAGLLYVMAISSIGVYGVILAGWSSNSKYPFLGAMRASAQMISYEVSIGIIIMTVVLCAGSLNLSTIVYAQEECWYIIPLLPSFVLFFISVLAETNRAPFDLVEAEGELVAGYYVEYSGILFVLFFIAEYANMILMSILSVIMFLGGWYVPFGAWLSVEQTAFFFSLKIFFIMFLFVWVRASVPRLRYDQLMSFG